VPLAALLPELRRKEKSSAELKAKAEKTSAAIYFDYGTWAADFLPMRTQENAWK
jgi:hypothetical protein